MYSGTLLTSKRCIVLLHALSGFNSLLIRYKVYSAYPREYMFTSWRYAEACEIFSIDAAPFRKNPIKIKIQLSYWVDIRKKIKLNLILTNPELFIIYWTCHHLFWFRFLKLLLIFYCQSSWREISILKKQFLIMPGVS